MQLQLPEENKKWSFTKLDKKKTRSPLSIMVDKLDKKTRSIHLS